MPNTEVTKKGPRYRKPLNGLEGKDYYRYRLARTITRPVLIKYLNKFCAEKDISPADAIHILAMDRLRELYGTPPNALQIIMDALQKVNQQQK